MFSETTARRSRALLVLRAGSLAAMAAALGGCDTLASLNPFDTAEKYEMKVIPDVPAEKVYDQGGKPIFNTENGPLAEVLARIENRTSYGETASGRYLTDEFAKEPFGWDFDVVRLLVVALLRAGKVEATSKGQTLDGVTGVEARDTFSNNNLFRQASFRPKKGIEFEELVKASEAFRDTFGSDVRELNAGAIVAALRKEVATNEDTVLVFGAGNLIAVADADAGTAPVRVTLTVTGGTATLSTTANLTVTGNGTANVQLTGALADVNAALNGLEFTPTADLNGPTSIQIVTDDQAVNQQAFASATA